MTRYEIFAKTNLTKVFRIYLKLDQDKRELSTQNHENAVAWRAGLPGLSQVVGSSKGQMTSVELGSAYALAEELAHG